MDLQLPAEIDLARDEDQMVILVSRRTPMTIARLVAGMALVLFTAQWIASPSLDSPLWFTLGLAIAALGVWLVWTGLGHTIGRTSVHVDDHAVTVTTGPVPLYRSVRLPLSALAGFRVDHKRRTHTPGESVRKQVDALPSATSSPLQTWKLIAVFRDGDEAVLVRDLAERHVAVAARLLLQEQLERWTG